MDTQAPRNVQEEFLRAIMACKRTQMALIDVGAIAAPEGGTEIHNWQLLNINLQNAMRLLLAFSQAASGRVKVRGVAGGGMARESSHRTDSDPLFDDPGFVEAIADLIEKEEA